MAELSFNYTYAVAFVLILQIETYVSLCYNNFIFFTKAIRLASTQRANNAFYLYSVNHFNLALLLLILLTAKGNSLMSLSLVYYLTVFLVLLNKFFSKSLTASLQTSSIFFIILPSFAVLMFMFLYVKSFILFFFYIELYSVFYYFCFLTSYNFTSQTMLKYKNGVMFLL